MEILLSVVGVLSPHFSRSERAQVNYLKALDVQSLRASAQTNREFNGHQVLAQNVEGSSQDGSRFVEEEKLLLRQTNMLQLCSSELHELEALAYGRGRPG